MLATIIALHITPLGRSVEINVGVEAKTLNLFGVTLF